MTRFRTRVAGHFGELMQGRLGPAGPVALITLPCPALTVQGQYWPGRGLSVHCAGQRILRPAEARRLMRHLGTPLSGRIALRAQMPAGAGAGASTAALVAVARLANPGIDPAALARACVAVEGATDPLMFAQPERLLWASRRAETLADMPPLPEFDVLGGFYGPNRRTDPRDMEFPDIADLIPRWHSAAQAHDLPALADLASTSARRCLSLRGPGDDPTEKLARDLGAPGFAIAHTGSARGLIFARGQIPPHGPEALRQAGLRGALRFRAGGKA